MTAPDLAKLQNALRDLIADAELAEALAHLRRALPEGSKMAQTIIALQARQSSVNQQRGEGTLDIDDVRTEYARITRDLQDLIDGLTIEDFAQPGPGGAADPDTEGKTGSILYRIPSRMKVGVEKKCVVRIAYEKKTLYQDIDINDDTHDAALRVAKKMEVHLFDPSPEDERAFDIRSESLPRQFLEKGFFTQWIFYAKPLREGTRPLKVRALVIINDEGEELMKELTFEAQVEVIATEPESEVAGAEPYQAAGYTFSVQTATAQSANVSYEIPSQPRSKPGLGGLKMMAYTIALLVVGGIGGYFSLRLPADRELDMAHMAKSPEKHRQLIAKYQNDPSEAAQRVVDDASFELAGMTRQAADYQSYLTNFPMGRHAAEAANWVAMREQEVIDQIKNRPPTSPTDPEGRESAKLDWPLIKRFGTEFGPSERMPLLLEEIKKRPGLADEAAVMLEKWSCKWVKEQQPLRRGIKEQFLRVFPRSRCLDGWEPPAIDGPGRPDLNPITSLTEKGGATAEPGQATGPDGGPLGPDGQPMPNGQSGDQLTGSDPAPQQPSPAGQNGNPTGSGPGQPIPGNPGNPSSQTGSTNGQGSPNSNGGQGAQPTGGPGIGTKPNPTGSPTGGGRPVATGGSLPDPGGPGQPGGGQPLSSGGGTTPKPGGGQRPNIANELFERDMVFVAGGSMDIGSEATSSDGGTAMPVHRVEFDGFYIMKFEVTQAQWEAVMGNNPSAHRGCGNCPVENVSWHDVDAFLQKLNAQSGGKRYRLPAEVEWEYAARCGQQNCGAVMADAWYADNVTTQTGLTTRPVGQKGPNGLGLHDMSGNVWEWCADGWHGNYDGAPSHAIVWEKGASATSKVVRGGCFESTPAECETYRRFNRPAKRPNPRIGFRLVRD